MVAELEVDDTTGFGAETITIHVAREARFANCVHNYINRHESPSTHLANSNATVRVHLGAEQQATYHVPAGPGTLWRVFRVPADDTTVIPQNALLHHSYPASIDCQ